MGSALSAQERDDCGAPVGVDLRTYALHKVYGVPKRRLFLDMYPKYTADMACKDIKLWRATGKGHYDDYIKPYHRKLARFLRADADPRKYAFEKIYGMTPEEHAAIGTDTYSRGMAIRELAAHLSGTGPRYKHAYLHLFFNKKERTWHLPGRRISPSPSPPSVDQPPTKPRQQRA
jgi:hypothetical protein